MVKLKTIKSAAKRINKTKKGKLLRRVLLVQHLARKKSKRAKAKKGKKEKVSPANLKRIKRLLPYL